MGAPGPNRKETKMEKVKDIARCVVFTSPFYSNVHTFYFILWCVHISFIAKLKDYYKRVLELRVSK